MTIQNIEIRNFQGCSSFSFKPDGFNSIISGTNGSGKTTIANAISWLFVNRAQSGEKSFDPQPLDSNGEKLHNLVSSVELTIKDNSGTEHVLRKENMEKYVKSRLTGISEYKGNINRYFIDGNGMTETYFSGQLEAMFGNDTTIRMLMTPGYFASELDWTERRQILMKISGDITNEEVFAEDVDGFKNLKDKMDTEDISEFRMRLVRSRTDIATEQNNISTRIDELDKTLENGRPEYSSEELGKMILEIETRGKKLQDEAVAVKKKFDRSDIKAKFNELKLAFAEKKAKYSSMLLDKNASVLGRIRELNDKVFSENSTVQSMKMDIDNAKRHIAQNEVRRKNVENALRAEESSVYDPLPEPEIETVCPYCGQALPAERIQQAKDKFALEEKRHKENWEQKHLTGIERAKADLEKIDADTATVKAKIEHLEAEIGSATARFEASQKELEQFKTNIVSGTPFEETEEAVKMHEEFARLEAEMQVDPAEVAAAVAPYREKLEALRTERDEKAALRVKAQQFEMLDVRKNDLIKQNEDCAKKDQEVLALIDDADKFISVRSRLLDQKISKFFPTVKFRFFEYQKNGGIANVCVPLVLTASGYIPYEQASTAEKINAGLEMTDTLATWFGFTFPVLIDNAESIISPRSTVAQQFMFKVTDSPMLSAEIALF